MLKTILGTILTIMMLAACTAVPPDTATPESPTTDTQQEDLQDNTDNTDDADLSVESNEADTVNIYAAVIREAYTNDNSFGGNDPGWETLYVSQMTNPGGASLLPPPEGIDPGEPRLLTDQTQNAISQQLADLPIEIVWVESPDAVPLDEETLTIDDGKGAIISLSNIHFQDEGESAIVGFWLQCGGLCGIGLNYILKTEDGAWHIDGTTGPAIMS